MKSSWWKKVDPVGLGVLAGALALFLPFCGSYGMWDPWETHYGEAARQVIVRGDWWTLYWEDDFFFSKPILLFWLMALSFKIFGVSEFAARLPVALCAVAGVYAAYWAMSAVLRSRRAGALAAAVMATTPLYAFIGRQCITDMPFVASMTIAFMALARFELAPGGRPRHIYMFYVFCGLATLAKGPLGLLLPGAVVLAYLVVSWNWGFLLRARIPTGAVVFLCVAAPWYLTMLLLHGERFYNEFIVYNNVQRATGSGVHGSNLDYLYYVRRAEEGRAQTGSPVLQVGTFPWLALFPAAIITYLVRRFGQVGARVRRLVTRKGAAAAPSFEERGRLHLAVLLMCWAIVAFAVFSAIPTKFHHYLLPLAPPVALIAAMWLFDASSGRVQRIVAAAGLLLAAGIVYLITGLLAEAPWELLNLFIYQYGRADLERFDVGAAYLYCGYALVGIFAVAAFLGRFRFQLSIAAVALALGLTYYNIDYYLPQASDCISQRDAFQHYEAERRPGDQLVHWRMNSRGEAFYGRSQSVKAVGDTHLHWLLSRADRTFIVGSRGSYRGLARTLRRVTGREPRILNPETCNTRLLLHDGPRVSPPRFAPPAGAVLAEVPESVTNRPENVRIGPDVSLVGYEVEWVGQGRNLFADVTLYLRCERETDEWWKVFLHGESAELPGRRAISDHTALGDAYPSVAWRRGDIIVDRTQLRVGWVLRRLGGRGELTIGVGLFHDETRAQITPADAHDGENRFVVGRYNTRTIPEGSILTELPSDVEALETPIQLGDVAEVVAYELRSRGRGRRAMAEVVLYLRARQRTRRPWQIFLHAQGDGDRRRSEDHHPISGRLRTTEWEPGRIIVDRTFMDLGELRRGTIQVHFGMFRRRNRRATIEPTSADAGHNRVLLGEIERE